MNYPLGRAGRPLCPLAFYQTFTDLTAEEIALYLISSEFPLVEIFRREKQGFWLLYTLGLSDTIELNSLDLRFLVTDVYQNTSFLEESNE